MSTPFRQVIGWLAPALLVAVVVPVASARQSPLVEAAQAGDVPTALRLLAEGGDANARTPDGATALMYAAYYDDVDLVRALIDAGAEVNVQSDFGSSALTEAAIIGSADVIAALLEAGADPDIENPEGETPLMAVARSGNVEAARLLVDAGADVNATEDWGGQSAIMWAAARGQVEMIRYLASVGADVNVQGVIRQWPRKTLTEPRPKDMNKGGFYALHYAAREGCVECARALIDAGANPDVHDPDRVTPLNLALLNLNFDVAATLIEAGADVNKWDLFGRSPIYMAADVSTLPVMGNGAMVVIPSEDEHTALDVARMLLEAGANPNLQLKRRPPYRNVPQDRGGDGMLSQGATAMLRAARAGDAAFVSLLIEYGAMVDLPNDDGITPLMAAAGLDFGSRVTRGRNRTDAQVIETMQVLLDAGANIDAQTWTVPRGGGGGRGGFGRGSQTVGPGAVPHQTALHGAASRGFTPFVEFLAEHGADLSITDATGRTALDIARGGSGGGGFGAPDAPADSETVALLESLMAERGIDVGLPEQTPE